MKIPRACESSELASLSVVEKMSCSMSVNLVLVLSFGIFVFYLLGIYNTLVTLSENDCEMTYMFEYPQFVEIPLPNSVRQTNPRYGLYGYAEGRQTEKIREMSFKGIPVLFIPGSSGSYKQGRSLASINLRKSTDMNEDIYFDYFMVDLNEDHSALYGGTLEVQTKFVRQCIVKIMTMYARSHKNKPRSVILIGHSVGGLIAKSVLVDPKFPHSYVKLIVSLASPLKAPVFMTDAYIAKFYQTLEDFHLKNIGSNHTTLVSIGGGNRDLLVRSELTYDKYGHVNVLSTAIPGVWSAADHLNIVWCKQLTKTLIRALYDCISKDTKQLLADHKSRYEVLEHHLLKRNAGKSFPVGSYERFVTFDQNAFWHEKMLRQFSVIYRKGNKINSYIMFKLEHHLNYSFAHIEALNLDNRDWIFLCAVDVKSPVKKCEKGENLSNMTEIAPPSPTSIFKKKFIHIDLFPIRTKNFTHVILNIPKTDSFVQVNIDIHDNCSRSSNYSVPSMYFLLENIIIKRTAANAAYYRINLIGFDSIWQGFTFGIETLSCKTTKNNAVLSFMIPWAAQHSHYYVTDKRPLFVKLTLATTRPRHFQGLKYPYIVLSLEPSCTYKVTIQSSITACASQIVVHFSGLLPSFMLAAVLLTLREQILHLDEGGRAFFLSSLCYAARRYYIIVQATIFGSKILGLQLFSYILPLPDLLTVENFNSDFFTMTLVMYGIAVALTYISGAATFLCASIISKAIHKMTLVMLNRSFTRIIRSSERATRFLRRAPILSSALLILLSVITSGAFSMCISTFLYFIKLTNVHQGYLEDTLECSVEYLEQQIRHLARQRRRGRPRQRQLSRSILEDRRRNARGSMTENESDSSGDSANSVALSENDMLEAGSLLNIHFHISLFLLWSTLTFLNIPSLLAWIKDFPRFLGNDPCLIPSVVVHVCCALLWQPGIPYPCRALSSIFARILFTFATISIIYGSVSIYRLSYIISATVLVVTVYQSTAKLYY